MHIVIMGCGRVGSTLAHILEDRDNTVAVIDRDPEAFRRLRSSFKGDRITGIGFDRAVLTQAGIERADAFVAVSSGDNSNIISARVARETFSVERVVARIYDPRRAEVYERLGIPTVATVRWTADQMLRKIVPEGGEPLWRDPTGQIVLAEMFSCEQRRDVLRKEPVRFHGHRRKPLPRQGLAERVKSTREGLDKQLALR